MESIRQVLLIKAAFVWERCKNTSHNIGLARRRRTNCHYTIPKNKAMKAASMAGLYHKRLKMAAIFITKIP